MNYEIEFEQEDDGRWIAENPITAGRHGLWRL